MTLMISEPSDNTIGFTQPDRTKLSSRKSPLYCGVCACPCLNPRLPTPQPEEPDILISDSHNLATPTWLHQFHHLQPTTGILPYPPPEPNPRDLGNVHKRIMPIHLYCLRAILGVVKAGLFNCGYGMSREEGMMIGYSIPRHVGFGPWVSGQTGGDVCPERSWSGLADQRSRWCNSQIESSHLISSDLRSPLTLDDPGHYMVTTHKKTQKTPFTNLPSHIITNIAQLLLSRTENEPQPVNPQQDLTDLLSLCRTSHTFRTLHLPESTWTNLTIYSVDRYRNDLVQRWRSLPNGPGGKGQVWIALDQAFMQPVKEALKCAEDSARKRLEVSPWDELGVQGYKARDVLYWWLYSEAWRSRRRVWRCAVLASATARDLDWW